MAEPPAKERTRRPGSGAPLPPRSTTPDLRRVSGEQGLSRDPGRTVRWKTVASWSWTRTRVGPVGHREAVDSTGGRSVEREVCLRSNKEENYRDHQASARGLSQKGQTAGVHGVLPERWLGKAGRNDTGVGVWNHVRQEVRLYLTLEVSSDVTHSRVSPTRLPSGVGSGPRGPHGPSGPQALQ